MTIVRELSADDWAVWKEVRLRSLLDSPGAFGSTYERELEYPEHFWRARIGDPEAVFVLAWQGDEPVGIGGGFQDLPGHVHVVAMWVAPQARGQGVAHLVLDALRNWAEERRLLLHLDVESANDAARRTYETYGFVATGETSPRRFVRDHPAHAVDPPGTQLSLGPPHSAAPDLAQPRIAAHGHL